MTENKLPEALKKVSQLNRTEKAAIILQALRKEGYNDNQVSHLLDVSRARVCQVSKKIDKGVLNPLVNKAKKAVKAILEGEAVGSATPKASDVLTAAKMVLDRADPIINKVESSQTIAHTYELKDEDRERYRKALGIIDAEYEVIPHNQKLLEESSNGRTEGFEPSNEGSIPSPSSNTLGGGTDIICLNPRDGWVDGAGYGNGEPVRIPDSDGLVADAVDVTDTLEHVSRDEPSAGAETPHG